MLLLWLFVFRLAEGHSNKFEERSEALELEGFLKPDMGSLTLSSLNFNKIASINSPDMIQDLAAKMKKLGIVPEMEAFDAGMINYAKYLIKRGFLTLHIILIFYWEILPALRQIFYMPE